MTQTVTHNFPVGTELQVEGDGKHRVVEPSGPFIHSIMPEGFIPTEWFEDEGGASIDPPEPDYVDPQDVKAVLSSTQSNGSAPTPEQEFNVALALFASEHATELRFHYSKSKNGDVQARTVRPDVIYHTNHGDTVIVGIDADKDDVRAFRLDRIVGRASV